MVRLVVICALMVTRIAQAGATPSQLSQPISICSPVEDIALQSQGGAASQTVVLDPNSTIKPLSLCRLKVTAPKSHVVNLQFLEVMDQVQNNETEKGEKEKRPSCVMNIYLPDNTKAPFWKGDPCSGEKMPDVDLLTAEFNILWSPPENLTTTIYQKTIILTAVGSGPFCKDPFQHTCMRIGRIPMLCVSDHLVCDGVQNCPKSSTNNDEDPKLCNTARNIWENLVVGWVKKYRPEDLPVKGNSSDIPVEWFEWQLVTKNVTKKPEVVNETHSATESISAMLNKYGPWGYLMMGLLICGTVLFFCGLWECCCKRPKPEGDPPPLRTPTTVLIMNCDPGGAPNPMPPQYEDLEDLPPSYTTLFPREEGRYTSISEEEANAGPSSSTEEKGDDDLNQSSSDLSVLPGSVVVETTVEINNSSDSGHNTSQEQDTDS
ncbi:uncharacterized protein [Euwallacea similis]|uniref:uncharacterized protein n=1 Tax=Euwallacea similis TaxID=1736056 RepID=UPI00344FA7B1